MKKTKVMRRAALFVGAAAWVFLLLSLASFKPTDWPSHQVHPHPPIQNLCGTAGAWVAYHAFVYVGQAVFPILFFSGICLALWIFNNRISDVWLRVIGLAVLATAFAAAVHHLRAGSGSSLPEGYGGLLGIATSEFLHAYFSTVGTRLVLLTAMLIGLLLVADDLVLRTPAYVGAAISNVRERAPSLPRIKFRFPAMPVLPRLSKFVTKDAKDKRSQDDSIDLDYGDEAEPARESAYSDESDPEPSAEATIPLPDEQKVATPEPVATVRKDIVVRLPHMIKPRQTSPPARPKELGEYHLPPWDCLADAEHGFLETQEKFVREKAAVLEQALREFNIDAHVVEIDTGPVITMYEISLAPGIKVGQITALSNDIMRALKAESVRIVAPVPGKSTVGIEVPNQQKERVRLKELMQLAPDAMQKMAIPLFLGKDASGEPLISDLASMPHLLIAGTTGSGKSVCINTIIMSIMYLQRPDMVKLILLDPKVVEMAPFKDIPHLMCPIINETGRATSVLDWACEKMDERYEILAEGGVRNIKGYNSLSREELIERFKPSNEEEEAKIPKQMPYVVIIIDELADLMMTSGKEVETYIVRLAQKARAVGIHLIVATQRPQATVVTGLIKSNLPSKIAFRMNSRMDSRIVLDQNGADLLLGQGDMLFLPPGASKPIRAQGTFVDDKEIRESVKLLRSLAEAQYEPELVQIRAATAAEGDMERDELFDDAVRIVLETKRGSVSLLQRRLTIGYSRASRLIEQMAAAGILGEYKGSQAREVNITLEEWEALKAAQNQDAESGMTV